MPEGRKEHEMTRRKTKKDETDKFLQSDDSSDGDLYEIKLYLDEHLRSKVIAIDNMQLIKESIKFEYYIENKNILKITGSDLNQLRGVAYILESLSKAYRNLKNKENEDLILDELDDLIDEVIDDSGKQNYEYDQRAIIRAYNGSYITPRTNNQDRLVDSIRDNVITIAKGCAGTGKSTLAIAMAIKYILDNRFDKILLIRPLTSVGGKDIGFLPGNADEKFGPYASAVTETMIDILGESRFNEWVRTKKIILTPTTFTRGANFKNAIVVVDEAQNLSEIEILTLLTRLCANGKIVITGDESQDDRKDKRYSSALTVITDKLEPIDRVGIVTMTINDVQRHGIVKDIIKAFE